MSLDRRLREGLDRSSGAVDERAADRVLGGIVRGARRRLLVRRLVAAAIVFAVGLAVFVLLPKSFDALRGDRRVPADRGSEKLPSTTLHLHGEGLGFSGDGTRLFAVDATGYVYDARTGERLASIEGQRGGGVGFSSDGRLFATAHGCGACDQESPADALDTYVYDTATGEELLHVRRGCCFAVFSPDASQVALPYDGHTAVFDVQSGDLVMEVGPFGNVAFSPDGRRFIVIADDEGIVGRVFDVRPLGDAEPALTLRGDTSGDAFGTQVAWGPDGSTLITVSNDREAVVWDATTGDERFTIPWPSGRLTSVAFGSDPRRFATGSSDGTATVWELSNDDARRILTESVDMGDDEWLRVALDPAGTRLMASTGTETVVWGIP